MRSYLPALALLASLSLLGAACEDPAKNVTAASVDSAKPTDGSKPAGALTISLADSKVEFTGSKLSGKHDGKFEKLSGWAYIDGTKLETAKLFVEIDMASVKTDSTKLDGHLKNDDFFAIAQHPTATFQLTGLKELKADGATHEITGNFKLRGVEKSITFPATVTIEKDSIHAKAEFKIKRFEFGVNYKGKEDDLIRDDVVIRLDVKAKAG